MELDLDGITTARTYCTVIVLWSCEQEGCGLCLREGSCVKDGFVKQLLVLNACNDGREF